MTDEALQDHILASLYIAHFERGEAVGLGTLAANLGIAPPVARSAFRCLHKRRLACCHAIGSEARITTSGILDVEQRVLAPGDLIERQRATRARVVSTVEQLSVGRGPGVLLPLAQVVLLSGVPPEEFKRNLQILLGTGILHWHLGDLLEFSSPDPSDAQRDDPPGPWWPDTGADVRPEPPEGGDGGATVPAALAPRPRRLSPGDAKAWPPAEQAPADCDAEAAFAGGSRREGVRPSYRTKQ
jgi:hypothetical protein